MKFLLKFITQYMIVIDLWWQQWNVARYILLKIVIAVKSSVSLHVLYIYTFCGFQLHTRTSDILTAWSPMSLETVTFPVDWFVIAEWHVEHFWEPLRQLLWQCLLKWTNLITFITAYLTDLHLWFVCFICKQTNSYCNYNY